MVSLTRPKSPESTESCGERGEVQESFFMISLSEGRLCGNRNQHASHNSHGLDVNCQFEARTAPESHQRRFPCSKLPWVCNHLSETLVSASGLHGWGREGVRCLLDGTGTQDKLEYHISQCKRTRANVLSRPTLSMPTWRSLPGFLPGKAVTLA